MFYVILFQRFLFSLNEWVVLKPFPPPPPTHTHFEGSVTDLVENSDECFGRSPKKMRVYPNHTHFRRVQDLPKLLVCDLLKVTLSTIVASFPQRCRLTLDPGQAM